MTLEQKLSRLKELNETKTGPDWEEYRKLWESSVSEIQHTIEEKWLDDYEEKGLMVFEYIPTKRIEPYIGEYLTTVLEITIANKKTIILEPVAAVTSEYDGKLEMYMRGNSYKKVSILRKLTSEGKVEWYIGKSFDDKNHLKLNKVQIERLIEEWL